MTPRVLALLVCASLSPAVYAAECDNPISQYEMNMCAHEEFLKSDQRLNKTYGQFINGLSVERQETLRQSQRGWVDYKDGHCELEASSAEGGSMQPMLYSDCQRQLTDRREKELRQLQEDFKEFDGI